MIVGIGLGLTISIPFAVTMLVLWIMGCIYNIPPVRSKDLPYLDVLSEAVNNPIRMLAGWFIVDTTAVPPASLLLSYWMVGCYFMAIKRYAELRSIGNPAHAVAYRKSFAFYTEERLLVAIVFYGSAAMLFFGAFIMRYRLELVLGFPLVALVMAVYLSLAFKQNGAAEAPERLTREPILMASVIACAVFMGAIVVEYSNPTSDLCSYSIHKCASVVIVLRPRAVCTEQTVPTCPRIDRSLYVRWRDTR
jgi:4-hydroxybenzoate polyprenyltransferase